MAALERRPIDRKKPSIEPFAGGASLSLGLLYAGAVKDVVLNDLDPRMWAFWRTAIDRPRELADRLRGASPSRELHAYCTGVMKSSTQVYEIGFAVICSNLLSFGGKLRGAFTVREQNRGALHRAADNLDHLAAYTDRITLHRSDAVSLMDIYKSADRVLLYVDPPYYAVGNSLYAVGMSPHAHSRLASWLVSHRHLSWVLSYDDHPSCSSCASSSSSFSRSHSASSDDRLSATLRARTCSGVRSRAITQGTDSSPSAFAAS